MIIYNDNDSIMIDCFMKTKLYKKLLNLEERFDYDFSIKDDDNTEEIELECFKHGEVIEYCIDYASEVYPSDEFENFFSFSEYEWEDIIDERRSNIIIKDIIKDIYSLGRDKVTNNIRRKILKNKKRK